MYNPASWYWDFGDGDTSHVQNPNHIYNTQGSWNVCLQINDSSCSSSFCQQVSNIPVQDVQASLFHQTTITPGYPIWVYLGYYNNGNVLLNGTIQYRYPAGSSFDSSTPAPVFIDSVNHLVTFNYVNLMPGTSSYVNVTLDASASLTLGALVYDTVWVNPVVGDATPADNIAFVSDSVVGSWDPNEKSVSPKGLTEAGYIPASTEDIAYIIHFQNTGNAAAQQVVVRDVINNNIDLTTVKVTQTTHEYAAQIIGSELVVSFSHINLPDSGTNYNASQGAFTVHAKLKPGLSAGTQILNTAAIYFDQNAPVITNTVVNTIQGGALGIGSVSKLDFALMPNPANNEIFIRGDFGKGTTYELIDQLGQTLVSGEMTAFNTRVYVSALSAGIYLVKVRSGEKTGVQRLVIAK